MSKTFSMSYFIFVCHFLLHFFPPPIFYYYTLSFCFPFISSCSNEIKVTHKEGEVLIFNSVKKILRLVFSFLCLRKLYFIFPFRSFFILC